MMILCMFFSTNMLYFFINYISKENISMYYHSNV